MGSVHGGDREASLREPLASEDVHRITDCIHIVDSFLLKQPVAEQARLPDNRQARADAR